MALPLELVRLNFESELERARRCADAYGFELEADVQAFTIRARYKAADDEKFILVGQFDDYKALPPLLEFEEPGTGARGTPKAYPKSKDSFFHTAPIICAPFNRKAYQQVHASDWNLGAWTTSRANNVNWTQYSTMAGMLVLVHTRLNHPDVYAGGRMG